MDNNAASQKYLIIIKVQLKVGSSCWISESKLLSYFVMYSMGTNYILYWWTLVRTLTEEEILNWTQKLKSKESEDLSLCTKRIL